MLRRRSVFATPFVVILGCSHPSDHTTSTPQTKHDDAAQVAPTDGDHVTVNDPGPNVTASNPGTGCIASPGHTCNPPAPSHKPIIVNGTVDGTPSKEDEGVFFKVVVDNAEGVTTHFTGVFLDEKGPIKDSDFVIKSRNGRTLLCVLKGKTELPAKQVRVYEPGAR